MEDYVRNYLLALPAFVVIDFFWIGVVMKRFYLSGLGGLARTEDGAFRPNPIAGLAAWALIPLGIVFFAVPRLEADSSAFTAVAWGGFFGAVTYGIYDMTNLATLQDYGLRLALVDTAWGASLAAFVTLVVWLVAR